MSCIPLHSEENPSRTAYPATTGYGRGFTLIELMVTVAVLAIVMAIAFPSFTGLRNSSRLAGTVNELVASIQLARTEAVRLNNRVVVCRSTNGAACAGGGAGANWPGWIVYVDQNADGAMSAGEPLLRAAGPSNTNVQVRGSAALTQNSLVFRSDGFARNGSTPTGALLAATFSVCLPTDKPAENVRLVSVASGSRISTASSNANSLCPQPAN